MLVRWFARVSLLILGITWALPPTVALAATSPASLVPPTTLTITEVLPDPASPLTDAEDEFIELYNPTAADIDLSGYQVQTTTTVTAKKVIPQDTIIAANDFVVLTSAELKFALANAGSSVEIIAPDGGAVGEKVTYKTAVTGSSWARHDDGTWGWSKTPTPADFNQFAAAAPASTPAPGQTESGVDGSLATSVPIVITELLPDPASPLTDAADEYIEIYNGGDEAIDLAGFIVKSGASLSTKHTLKSVIVEPDSYVVLTSGVTKVALSNAGSSIAIYAPDGVTPVGTTVTYPKAPTGAAWAFDGSGWMWTTTPTPGAANHISEPAVKTAAASTTSSKTTKAAKVSVAKAKAVKTPKATKAKTQSVAAKSEPVTSPGARWLIFALLGLTIAYCIYEFRYDLQRFFLKLKKHPRTSR